MPCAHGKLNVREHRTTPKPETHITSEEKLRWQFWGGAAGERENREPKRREAAQPPPPWFIQQQRKLGATCTRKSASYCCCCSVLLLSWQREHANEARATRREGRRVMSDGAIGRRTLPPRVVRVSFGRVDG